MVRVITQETFDSVVKENIKDFDMEKEEAIKEAKEQFESQVIMRAEILNWWAIELRDLNSSRRLIKMTFAKFQGVDLSNVVLGLEEDLEIVKALKSLNTLSISDSNKQVIHENCNTLAIECKKGMAEKVLCTNHKGYEILVELAKKSNDQQQIQASAIGALASLLDKNPDAFDVEGFSIVVIGLDPSKGIYRIIIKMRLRIDDLLKSL